MLTKPILDFIRDSKSRIIGITRRPDPGEWPFVNGPYMSVCNHCYVEMPKCWHTICGKCFHTFCYVHSEAIGGYWYCIPCAASVRVYNSIQSSKECSTTKV